MKRSSTPIAIAATLGALLATGCYNPDLGDSPFSCNKNTICPHGYECVCRSNCNSDDPAVIVKICVPEGNRFDSGPRDQRLLTDAELEPSKEGPVYVDGAKPVNTKGCIDDASEPGSSRATALAIPASTGNIPGWAICPKGDVDQFAIDLEAGDTIVVEIKFTHSDGDLELALFDPQGKLLDDSRSEDSNEKVQVSSLAAKGTYIIAVWGFKDAEADYELDLTVN